MSQATIESRARRLLQLLVHRHKVRADGIALSRNPWESVAAEAGGGLDFARGIDYCVRQGWLVDHGARLLLTARGYDIAHGKRSPPRGRVSPA
jgi:hypothetical protein